MSQFSSHCMLNGIVCSMLWRATSLPSTFSTPVPPRPIPLTLLKASVPKPRPSYLKSEQVRPPLVGVAAHEAVEIVEAHAGRPLVERPGPARLELRGVVVLAEPRRPVAMVLQDPADGRLVAGHGAVVAGEARRLLGHDPEAHRMVVAPGDQRGACRRAQRGRVEVGVAQAVGG